MDSFFVEAQSAHLVCGRKEGGSVPVAERAARRTGGKGQKVGWRGMKKSGDALSKRAENRKGARESRKGTRRIEKAHGRIEKARRRVEKQRVRNRKTRNRRIKASGPKSERVWGSKSESARARNQKACNLPTTL